jgi:hypothetical protein
VAWLERGVNADTELQSDLPTTVFPTLNEKEYPVTVMIGVDPHEGSHTAVGVDHSERSPAELRVRPGATQLERLFKWAERFPERTWAVENATGLGYLLTQQLVAAGERVLDVQPKLAAVGREDGRRGRLPWPDLFVGRASSLGASVEIRPGWGSRRPPCQGRSARRCG